MSADRKINTLAPIRVVSSALVCNPVESIAAYEAAAFSAVLEEAINDPRRQLYAARSRTRDEFGKGSVERGAVGDEPTLAQYRDAMDLHVRLETMLREKSILIAVV
jgi:hypothetical protein